MDPGNESIGLDSDRTGHTRIIGYSVFVITLLLSIGVVFVAAEGYLKYKYRLDGAPIRDMVMHDDNRGWSLRPGQYVNINLRSQTKSSIFINSLGFRDDETSLQAKPGKRRLTVIGDSFVFGQVLNYGERFTEILERMLGDDWEVVNVSVPGYGTGQEILFFRELKSRGYDPGEKIVLVFFTNDILDNLGKDYGTGMSNPRKPVFAIEDGSLNILKPANSDDRHKVRESPSFLEDSLVADYLGYLVADWAGRNPDIMRFILSAGVDVELPRTPGIITGWYTEGWDKRWKVTEEILQYASRKVFDNADFSIMFMASPLQIEPSILAVLSNIKDSDPRIGEFLEDMDRPQRTLETFCRRNNISFIDTTSLMRERTKIGTLYFNREGHLNQLGSHVVAEVLNTRIAGTSVDE